MGVPCYYIIEFSNLLLMLSYFQVHPENFTRQHLVFLKNNYELISTQTLKDRIITKTLKNRSICLTFDDGYFDNFSEAFPLLEKYQIPATIFVCTGNIGTENEILVGYAGEHSSFQRKNI